MTSPGRPRGTRVTICHCGRRIVGLPESTLKCPDCGKHNKISASRKKNAKRPLLFLKKDRT